MIITGDGAYIKKINRSIILSKIFEYEMISRADLSKITGLNKATISVQVADLLDEDLVKETKLEHNVVGRRPIMLSINKSVGYVLGIDLDYKNIQYMIADLSGKPVHYESVDIETDNYNEIVSLLIEQIRKYKNQYTKSRYGLVSVMIGVHGTVNKEDESIFFIPTYQWQSKTLKEDLNNKLDIDISIQNNANLSAYAERVYKHHESNHLLSIMLTSGIGVGIMVDGKIHKGYNGYAGEMGHMIISQNGKLCRCGNSGCWEQYSSETSLMAQFKEKLNVPVVTYDDIEKLIAEDDPTTIALIEQYICDLSTGLNNIINMDNPETLVLTSEVLKMYPNAIEKIESNFKSTVSKYGTLEISELGTKSCSIGACAFAIQRFLEVPELRLTLDQ